MSRKIKNSTDRSKQPWWLSAIILVLAFLFAPEILDFDNPNLTLSEQEMVEVSNQFTGSNFNTLPQQKKIPVDLAHINDGDTIRVIINDYEVPVRYLMIDTPEMNYNNGEPEPFAQDAKDLNQEFLTSGEQIYIEFDVGPYTDDYGRALAYVYSDDVLINEALVEAGLAEVRYINPPNNSYENLLKQAEDYAKEERLNLWN